MTDFSASGDFARMSLIRVLIVDNVEFWRPVYSMVKADPSFLIVFQATGGVKAVQEVEKLQPTVVLLDISLRGLNGLEAGAMIRRVAPNAKIVFVTMEHDPDIVEAARQVGARVMF